MRNEQPHFEELQRTDGFSKVWHTWFNFYLPGWRPNTAKAYAATFRYAKPIFGARRPIHTMHYTDIARFISHLERRGVRPRYYVGILRTFFKWAIEDGLIERNPVSWSRLPRMPRSKFCPSAFNYEQFQRVLRAAEPYREKQSYWPTACYIAYYTGLRISDVAHLCWHPDPEDPMRSYVNFDDEVIVSRPRKLSRYNQRLEIPMEADLYTHLIQVYNERDQTSKSPYVLPYFHAYYHSRNSADLSVGFRLICDNAGLLDHSFHSFRHGFVTRLINAGVDPVTICAMTGQSLRQVQRYAHVDLDGKREAIQKARVRAAMHHAHLADMGFTKPQVVLSQSEYQSNSRVKYEQNRASSPGPVHDTDLADQGPAQAAS